MNTDIVLTIMQMIVIKIIPETEVLVRIQQ